MATISDKLANYLKSSCGEVSEVTNLKGGTGKVTIIHESSPSDGYYDDGLLVLEDGSSIGPHEHGILDGMGDADIETYEVLEGTVEINGELLGPGESRTCPNKESSVHNCVARGPAVVRFSKQWV